MKRSSAVRSQGAHGAHGGGPASAVVLIRRALLDAAAAIAVMTVLAACVKHVPADFTTANELPDDDRKPYGIAVDRTSEPPLARHVPRVVALPAHDAELVDGIGCLLKLLP